MLVVFFVDYLLDNEGLAVKWAMIRDAANIALIKREGAFKRGIVTPCYF